VKADLILSADWHLREDQPEAWVGDYFSAQEETLNFLNELQAEHDFAPMVIAGDIYDKWKVSHDFERWVMANLPRGRIFVVPGQHDLRHHNIDKFDETALAVLHQGGFVQCLPDGRGKMFDDLGTRLGLYGFPWGSSLRAAGRKRNQFARKIAVAHVMTFAKSVPFPGCTADPGHRLMKRLQNFDLIVTGDNHEPFEIERDGTLLVNPGSLMRISADQIKHRPRVYLWNAKKNQVETVYIPQNKGDVSRDHLKAKERRDDRIDAFVSRLGKGKVEISLSFKKNLREVMDKSRTRKAVRRIVDEVTGG